MDLKLFISNAAYAMRGLLVLVFVLITSETFSYVFSKTTDTVNIAAILSKDTSNGKITAFAMKAAVDDINSDPNILPGKTLSLSFHDAKISVFLNIIGALKFMEDEIVAVVGPFISMVAHVLTIIANELHVPFLSSISLDPSLSPFQYPYFIQTSPNDLYQMTAIAEMVSYFGYRDVTVIYTDSDMFGSTHALGDELRKKRCKLSYKAILSPNTSSSSQDVIHNVLVNVRSMESRVIVLHAYPHAALLVLETAKRLGMMNKGYVWIATTWLSSILDSTGINSTNAQILQGVLTLRPHVPDSGQKLDFEKRWRSLSNGSIGLNMYGLYAYDTVWMVAHALDKFFHQGGNISFSGYSRVTGSKGTTRLNFAALRVFDGGKQLLTNLLQTNMSGLTGPISFTSDRSRIHPAFDIINVVGNQVRVIGYWSNHSGLSIQIPEILYAKPSNRSYFNQHLRSVVWPGNTTEKPRGWEFSNNGRPLKIGVPLSTRFNGIHELIMDIFLAALKLIPYQVPHEFVMFGDDHKNPNYTKFVNEVANYVFDVAIGDISIIPKRIKVVDFTLPYIESGLVVVVPIKKRDSSVWAFLLPFTPLMWAVTTCFFIVTGGVLWILEHDRNEEFGGPLKQQLLTVFMFTWSTLSNSHREKITSALGRAVLLVWLFVVFIINSSYTASLSSILTIQQLSSPIRGIDSLISTNERIGFQVGSFVENYLIEELNIPKSRLMALGSPQEYAEKLRLGIVAAVVDERPYIDLFLSTNCGFQVVGEEFTTSGWGFAFPRGSPLAVDMSTAILALSGNGELDKIRDYWVTRKTCNPRESEQIQLESFGGLFLIFGVGCVLALLIYFCAIFREFRKHYPDLRIGSRSLRKFLSFVDEKEEVSKNKLKIEREMSLSHVRSRS